MNKLGVLGFVVSWVPRLLKIRRSTWIGLSISVFLFFGLLIWAAFSLVAWGWGQAQSLIGGAPETARGVLQRAEEGVPALRQKLELLVPQLKVEWPEQLPREASGADGKPDGAQSKPHP